MKKLLLLLLLSLGTVWGQTTGSSFYDVVLDSSGHPISNATIKVYTGGNCGTLCNTFAPIYYDYAQTAPVNQASAPIVSDINGNYHFFAQSGNYDIVVSGRGVSLKLTNSILGASSTGGAATGITPTGLNGTFWGVQSGVQGWYNIPGFSGLTPNALIYATGTTTIATDGLILTNGAGTLSASEFNGPQDGIVGGLTPSAGTFTTLIGSTLQVTGISGSTQCVHADTSGNFTGTGADCTVAALSGVTSSITGTALTATCDSGTVTVTGAAVGSPVVVGTTDGTDVGGAFYLRASVTATNTVTVYVCGTGTPSTKAYNVRVIQ